MRTSARAVTHPHCPLPHASPMTMVRCFQVNRALGKEGAMWVDRPRPGSPSVWQYIIGSQQKHDSPNTDLGRGSGSTMPPKAPPSAPAGMVSAPANGIRMCGPGRGGGWVGRGPEPLPVGRPSRYVRAGAR